MTRPLLSTDWYRVRALRPRLHAHVQVHRHAYRGRIWHVVEDRLGGKHQRFNPAAWRVIARMDGRHSMDELWRALTIAPDDDTPTQDELIRLLGQLHAADLVHTDASPDVAELFERRARQVRRQWLGRVANPIALRIPLFDPDRLLQAMLRWLRPLRGARLAVLWLAVVGTALALVPSHWAELTGNAREQLLASGNLLQLALLFPLVKAVHEFAHALACRARGGEVHEMGLMLLVFYPVPYVDVSQASAFASKWQRALVGAAGMLAELFVAALALFAWLALEPGLARALAYDVAVLASVTTLFFNANPLLRYDGYYILADLIECPNLGQRATRWWQYLAEHRVFGVRGAQPPEATAGERRWFIAYAPLAYAYRLTVAFGIALLVAQRFFVLGVLIAIWSLAAAIVWPLAKALHALATAPRFADRGPRIRAVLAGAAIALVLALFVLPLPYHTQGDGVLWLPERAVLRAEASGFASEWLAAPGAPVVADQPLLRSVDAGLAARIAAQEARLEELDAQFDAAWGSSQARAQQLEQTRTHERAALARLREEAERLTLRAPLAGTLLVERPLDLPGRYVRQGEVVGYVRTGDAPLVRLVLPQADVDTVRLATRRVQVLMPQALDHPWTAQLTRSVPAAAHSLPGAALGSKGGGAVVTDPRDDKGLATLESVFEFELELPQALPAQWLGSRVHVRFEHPAEPVGLRLWRALRRAFLTQFQL